MWNPINLINSTNRVPFFAALSIALAVAVFTAGWKIEGWRWDAAVAKQEQEALKLQKQAQKKTQDLQKVADDVQEGATTAIRSVYDYYEKHPRIKYVDGANCVPSNSGSETMPNATQTSSRDNASSTNNGHATTSTEGQIQIIEPDLVKRCAITTVQALECKQYVESIYKVYTE